MRPTVYVDLSHLSRSDAFRALLLADADAEAARLDYIRVRETDPYNPQAYIQACIVYAEAAAVAAQCRERYEKLINDTLAQERV